VPWRASPGLWWIGGMAGGALSTTIDGAGWAIVTGGYTGRRLRVAAEWGPSGYISNPQVTHFALGLSFAWHVWRPWWQRQAGSFTMTFEADPLALELCKLALDKGWVDAVPKPLPSFILMPLQHSENMEDQERSVAEFEQRDAFNHRYALLHRDQIKRFGRFPGRNQALGRVSTPEEREVIERGETF